MPVLTKDRTSYVDDTTRQDRQARVRPELVAIDESELLIDERYQRPLAEKKTARLAAEWDDLAAGALIVNRRTSGAQAVVDGRHRLAAFRRRHPAGSPILCLRYHGLTEVEEAELFVRCNSTRSAPIAIHAFHARLYIGERQATEIQQAVDAAGLAISPSQNYQAVGEGVLQSVASLDRLYATIGGGGLQRVLGILTGAFGRDPVGLRGYFLWAVGHFLDQYPGVDDARLIERLRAKTAGEWLLEARGLAHLLGGATWLNLARLGLKHYNTNLQGARRLPNRLGREA